MQYEEKRSAVLIALLLCVKVAHEQFVPYVAAHAAQPAPNSTTPTVTSSYNPGLLPSPVYEPCSMPSWLKSKDVCSAADGDNTTCRLTTLYTSTDWSEIGWNASSGQVVPEEMICARVHPFDMCCMWVSTA